MKTTVSDYESRSLPLFFDHMDSSGHAEVLDVGPIFRDKISFLAKRVNRLHVCDMFRHLVPSPHSKDIDASFWTHWDYARNSFNGILLWDLIDYLEKVNAAQLIKICHELVKPGGMVMFLSKDTAFKNEDRMGAFSISGDYKMTACPLGLSDLPSFPRQNREFLDLLLPFKSYKSILYRNGIREYLFQK